MMFWLPLRGPWWYEPWTTWKPTLGLTAVTIAVGRCQSPWLSWLGLKPRQRIPLLEEIDDSDAYAGIELMTGALYTATPTPAATAPLSKVRREVVVGDAASCSMLIRIPPRQRSSRARHRSAPVFPADARHETLMDAQWSG